MTCAHPPGRVACPRCHSFRAVRVCPVCHARVEAAREAARKDAEYASGYNSSEWISGRNEGFELAVKALSGTLEPGQWNGYRPLVPPDDKR